MALEPAGRRLLLVRNAGIQLWDLERGGLLAELAMPGRVAGAAFSFDGQALGVLATEGDLTLLDAMNGAMLGRVEAAGGKDFLLLYQPECARAVVWTDRGETLLAARVRRYFRRWESLVGDCPGGDGG
jgi:hypothetical protein